MTRIYSLVKLKERRRELRKRSTTQENLLWEKLRNRKIGCKFRRQHSVGGYILDFYCPVLRLAIELDGSVHKDTERRVHDKNRILYLEQLDITVIRFWDGEIIKNIDVVIREIKCVMNYILRFDNPPQSPLTLRGEE